MEIWWPIFMLLAFISLFLVISYLLFIYLKQGIHVALSGAFAIIGTFFWIITELLSGFKAITLIGLISAWSIVGFLTVTTAIKLSKPSIWNNIFNRFQDAWKNIKSLPTNFLLALAYIFLSILLLSMIAFAAAPNNWDSMAYHMSRVMHWEQNQTLEFYTTSDERQLFLGPMAEIVILNFQILAGNDRLANIVQLSSMIGCLVGVSLITRLLGGNFYAQIFSVLATLTIPMGIMQSTSTQNDYVVGLWIMCFSVFLLVQIQGSISLPLSILAGLSLGLAINTKSTAILYTAPIGLWFAIVVLKRQRIYSIKNLSIMLGVTIIIVAPHSLRNYKLYTNPLYPSTGGGYSEIRLTNDFYSMPVLASNTLRNLGMQLGSPNERLNALIDKCIRNLHTIIGLEIDDPRTTWLNTKFEIQFRKHEDLAGNPLHLLLAFISVPLIFFNKSFGKITYFLCVLTGFLLFNLLLKWQPWHSRLLLPIFVMAMPLVALVIINFSNQWTTNLIMLAVSAAAIPYLFTNESRPAIGPDSVFKKDRATQYFQNSMGQYNPFYSVAEAINNLSCNQVGLIAGKDDWEYPIWILTDARKKSIRIEHILVPYPSKKFHIDFAPCAIIATYPLGKEDIQYQDKLYIKYLDAKPLSVFILSDTSK